MHAWHSGLCEPFVAHQWLYPSTLAWDSFSTCTLVPSCLAFSFPLLLPALLPLLLGVLLAVLLAALLLPQQRMLPCPLGHLSKGRGGSCCPVLAAGLGPAFLSAAPAPSTAPVPSASSVAHGPPRQGHLQSVRAVVRAVQLAVLLAGLLAAPMAVLLVVLFAVPFVDAMCPSGCTPPFSMAPILAIESSSPP